MVAQKRKQQEQVTHVDVKKAKKLSQSEQRKPSSSEEPLQNDTQLDISTPVAVIESLLKPIETKEFFESYWEKQPLHIKRSDSGYYGGAFTRDTFLDIASNNKLLFQADVNVCRYVDGEKEMLNEDGIITNEKAKQLMDEKNATLQFLQPQRFTDILWCVMEKLESYFGNHVGSNVYITPPGSQGLAPHCDDVEAFILQLEGTKQWKIYKPMVELSRDYTQDLTQDIIGEPILEPELQTGDLLYLPRGYIHQANVADDKHSTHITLSTYQTNTIGDFMTHAVAQAIENALEDDVSFRKGLPINYLSYLGTSHDLQNYIEIDKTACTTDENGQTPVVANGHAKASSALPSNALDERVVSFKQYVKEQLAKLVDHLDVHKAADAMADDFFTSRLPPFRCSGDKNEDDDAVKIPLLTDDIRVRFKDHACITYNDEVNDEEEDSQCEEDEEDDSDGEEDEMDVEIEEKKSKASEVPEDEKKVTKKRAQSDASSLPKDSVSEEDENEEFRYDLNEEGEIIIKHSLHNDRETHMCATADSGKSKALKLACQYACAVKHLFLADGYTRVSELPGLDDDEEKMYLATVLSTEGLIEIKSV